MNHRGHTHIDDSLREKKTTEQETSRHKSMKTELISHQLQLANKKSRSNSLNGDLEHEEKTSSDEVPPEKLDFKQIRNRFEKLDKSENLPPPPLIPRKRPSIPVTSTILTSTFPAKQPITYRGVSARPPSIPLARLSSIQSASADEPDNTLKLDISRLSLNNKTNSFIEEADNASSPLPNSEESSLASENGNNDQPKSIQSIRAFFNEPKNFPINPPVPPPRTFEKPAKLSPATSLQIPHQPPPARLPPSPEKYIKSQLCDMQSFPSVETADSATGDSSLSSNPNLSPQHSSASSFTDDEVEDVGSEQRIKLRKCLEEVYATEKTYVSILYVLAVKVTSEIKNTCDDKDENLILTFNNTYKPLLGNIQQIYQLHHAIILPEMEEYITGHSLGNMWSVLEKNFKVIEVLYKNYYVTYYDTQGKLDDLCKTYPLLNEAMLKCQVHLGNLYPLTQLNCPNQRLLRYILCLKTYMKYLDEQHSEYKHTRSIHDELDRIAVRCEEELVISSAQLNELKERLDNKFECIKDHRKLLWHGPLKKQSPRRHLDIAQRYMILFSDCILVCGEDSGRKLEIKRELSMRGITVDVVQGGRASLIANNDQPNTGILYYPFRVNAVEKSYEFLADKESDRGIWVKKIRQASDDYNKRNTAIELRHSGNHRDEQQLGFRAPAWVNDVDVTRCQNCNNRFRTTMISSRRHHCRSCGRCVCGQCSTGKLALDYCKNEGNVRVCDTCYTHFTGTILSKSISVWPKPTREIDQTILFGDFRTINSGVLIWIALQEDFQLHIYGGKLDQAEEYAIKLPDIVDIQLESEIRTFTIKETTKVHIFTIDSNHQIIYEKNDLLDDKMKSSETKLIFYTNLWFEAMQLARSTTLPDWYIRKRDSADSGVSNIG